MIIVIDGPAGSGKSSTARELSNRLDLHFLDSGALYRAVTYFWVTRGKPDKDQFFAMLPDIDLGVDLGDNQFKVLLNGIDVSDKIRTPEVADNVSKIASLPQVRSQINAFMRELVGMGEFIADGRDLGTAVFPDADLKFYMDASIQERANRRYKDLKVKNKDVTLHGVEENLKSRDHADQTRSADPLKMASDAVVIDTSDKSFEEQVNQMANIIVEHLKS